MCIYFSKHRLLQLMSQLTKAVRIRLENAPKPPVGRALVKEIKTTAQTVGSVNASTSER